VGKNRTAKIIGPIQISQVFCRGHRQSKGATEKKVIANPQAQIIMILLTDRRQILITAAVII
jgi:hypothetical protein